MIVKTSRILLTAIVCLVWNPLHGATRECDSPPMKLQEQFDTVENGLPVGWKAMVFSKIGSHTEFMVIESDGGSALKAHAKGSASGLTWEKEFDPHCLAEISWKWKISKVLPLGDVTRKAGDDLPARVFIMFPYDPEQADLFTRIVYGIYKLFYGEYPPGKAIGYIWANRLPVGEVVESAYTSRLKLFALKSGDDATVRRDLPRLASLVTVLNQSYELRIVSGAGRRSGVFRVPKGKPSKRNYYVIVEARAGGGRLTLRIANEETGRTRSVRSFGIRVPRSVYEQVKADKLDNGIIDKRIFGVKKRGARSPEYRFPVAGGMITRW